MSMIFSRYCELLCCCCFPASSACKTTSTFVISLVWRRQINHRVEQSLIESQLRKQVPIGVNILVSFSIYVGKPVGSLLFLMVVFFSPSPFTILPFHIDSLLLQSRIKRTQVVHLHATSKLFSGTREISSL